ncbi:Bestrophin-2 [Zootermopsis nevadensis]|uniref:Bestrophin homolog n=1 Tax=Zootermopsis nevadensis TaxID=136037 RepID=A0A067RJT4_ZOONE|nr:Bestrophin-2 [Zootermopsis nevadensis]
MKNSVDYAYPKLSKHWLPITWAANITTRARLDQKIHNDVAAKTIIDELNKFRGQCGLLLSYDSISVPLVYTQVVTLAVYTYFITCIMGRQWVEGIDENLQKQRNSIDLYFPIFTTLQARSILNKNVLHIRVQITPWI